MLRRPIDVSRETVVAVIMITTMVMITTIKQPTGDQKTKEMISAMARLLFAPFTACLLLARVEISNQGDVS
jgi:hypothetical protein